MHNSQNKKKLQLVLLVFVAVLTLSIGYASISALNIIINGNGTVSVSDSNFKVYFTNAQIIQGTGTATIDDDPTVAYFDVTGLSKVGDSAVVTYTVLNDSNGIGVELLPSVLTSSNQEYFKVTEEISTPEEKKNKLQAGESTTIKVTVDVIKTPIDEEVSTSVSIKINANPTENEDAIAGEYKKKVAGEPESFATDSWATIQKAVQNNNTSAYNVGDTKTVSINNTNYTIRIANKSINENCSNEDYSETACGFVVEFVDIITRMRMRNTATNLGGYPATLVYDYLKNTLYGQLPQDLQTVIKPTRVISGCGCNNYVWEDIACYGLDNNGNNFETVDNLYLLSLVEIIGVDSNDTAAETTTQLEYYIGMPTEEGCSGNCTLYPRAIKQYNSSNSSWWLRSTISSSDSSFGIVYSNGNIGGMASNHNGGGYAIPIYDGVAPAFRIA